MDRKMILGNILNAPGIYPTEISPSFTEVHFDGKSPIAVSMKFSNGTSGTLIWHPGSIFTKSAVSFQIPRLPPETVLKASKRATLEMFQKIGHWLELKKMQPSDASDDHQANMTLNALHSQFMLTAKPANGISPLSIAAAMFAAFGLGMVINGNVSLPNLPTTLLGGEAKTDRTEDLLKPGKFESSSLLSYSKSGQDNDTTSSDGDLSDEEPVSLEIFEYFDENQNASASHQKPAPEKDRELKYNEIRGASKNNHGIPDIPGLETFAGTAGIAEMKIPGGGSIKELEQLKVFGLNP